MSFEIEEGGKDGIAILDLKGSCTLDAGDLALRKWLALLNVNRAHLKLFLLTRLALAFESSDEQDAVNSFFQDRELKHFDVLEFVQQEGEQNSQHGTPKEAAC